MTNQGAKELQANEGELLEVLADVIHQACWDPREGCLDSQALTAYAIGMRLLAQYGVIEITSEFGRRVMGVMKNEGELE